MNISCIFAAVFNGTLFDSLNEISSKEQPALLFASEVSFCCN